MPLVLIQTFTTFAMTGLIWFVQVVHYPLFRLIPNPQHAAYASAHQTRTGWIVAPLMLLELATALALLLPWLRPAVVSQQEAIGGILLLAVIWLSTALLQIPLHRQLLQASSPRSIHRLVTGNWIRTIAWSLRSALVLTWLERLL